MLVGGDLLQVPALLQVVEAVERVAQCGGCTSGVAGCSLLPGLSPGLGHECDVAVGVVRDPGGGLAAGVLKVFIAVEEEVERLADGVEALALDHVGEALAEADLGPSGRGEEIQISPVNQGQRQLF